uniref:AlNc14C486G11902 protein n=1 Tax=Albugo laibachii Nc14 TaxID=890382 RepID=F0X0F9_9STRA|nr:AlNc14C486G11902 [Albugo laibachii Nc14]|eukprot:CCA27248.1 AlNc14C486G11902 [Albugo laibachii Nc14]
MVKAGAWKPNIRECIDGSKYGHSLCSRIIFVPNFMCEHEFSQSEPNTPTDHSEHQHGNEDSARHARHDVGEDVPHQRNSCGLTLRLFGVDIAPEVDVQVSNNIEANMMNRYQTRHPAPIKHIASPTLEPSCSEPNVMLVQYGDENAQKCVKSLALRYNVVMFSTIRQYVWMLCEPEDDFVSAKTTELHFSNSIGKGKRKKQVQDTTAEDHNVGSKTTSLTRRKNPIRAKRANPRR